MSHHLVGVLVVAGAMLSLLVLVRKQVTVKLDRNRVDVWKRLPVLFVAAENDRTVPNALSEETARVMGVKHILLGRDWGMPGHGHVFVIERPLETFTSPGRSRPT